MSFKENNDQDVGAKKRKILYDCMEVLKDVGLELLSIKKNTFIHKGNVNCLIKTLECLVAVDPPPMVLKVKASVEEAMSDEPDKDVYVVIGMTVSDDYDTVMSCWVVNKEPNFIENTAKSLDLPIIGDERNPVLFYVLKADSGFLEELELYIMEEKTKFMVEQVKAANKLLTEALKLL